MNNREKESIMFKHNAGTLPLLKSASRSALWRSFLVVPLALALGCLTLPQTAQAQDGDEGRGNTAEGFGALHTYISTASAANYNTAIGGLTLYSDTTGSFNTGTGYQALFANTTGDSNTATGYGALFRNTTGSDNTAIGYGALYDNTTGVQNTANGSLALELNTTGVHNTAIGFAALLSNTTVNGVAGDNNTAIGWEALQNNTTGGDNIAIGDSALFRNTTGGGNVSTGDSALGQNTIGNNNTATGVRALNGNTTGSGNIAVGADAGRNLTTGSHNIDIGNVASAGESGHIRIGTVGTHTATYIAGIHGATVASALQVVVDVNGHLGTVGSSARFKDAIKPMDKASEAILALKPVTFRYKHELDPDGVPQFGLVAEQVEQVSPDLVARDAEGKVYTVRYEAVNAMLLNEFLKEHRRVQTLEATTEQLKKQVAVLTAGLQKVNDQLERSNSAPQRVAVNQ
jgi:hypothetical protein